MKSLKNKLNGVPPLSLRVWIIFGVERGRFGFVSSPVFNKMRIHLGFSMDMVTKPVKNKIVAALCLQIINKNQTNLRIINRRR
jgi:hypothetical protein